VLSAALAVCGSTSSGANEDDGAAATIAAQHAALTPAASIASPTMAEMHEHATATISTAPIDSTLTVTAPAAAATATAPTLAAQSTATPAEHVEVHIVDFGFDPPMVSIAPGTTVTFINDGVDHTATSKSGAPVSFDSGILHTGQSFSFTFDTPGNYDYWCLLHPNMVGMIMVQ
jgi:plastocyanin